MYKVFFNDRTLFLTDEFIKNFQAHEGLFYKFSNKKELNEIIEFYSKLRKINNLYIYHTDIEKLRDTFRGCFTFINAAGGLVKNKKNEILIIKRRGFYDLPKGKIDKGESIQHAAIREVEEECGISGVEITKPLLSTYHTYDLKNKQVLKKTYWFEMIYKGNKTPVPEEKEDITEAKWVNKKDLKVIFSNTYNAILDVFCYCGLTNE